MTVYLDYFNFHKHPFQMAADDQFLYLSSQHSKALAYMDYAVRDEAGFVVISGDIGSGKTTLAKRLVNSFAQSCFCFNVSYTLLGEDDLFRVLLKQIDSSISVENKVDMLYLLQDFLLEKKRAAMPVVLLIDEAQYLSNENLEDIRMLTCIEGGTGPMLRLIFLGQPELYQKIVAIPQLNQRVKLHFRLRPLSLDETYEYIESRIMTAGLAQNTLFDDSLCEKIYILTAGTPRLINKVCDALLMCAFADNKQQASEDDIALIIDDLMLVDDDCEVMPKAPKPNNAATDGLNDGLLLRVVEALENIDHSLQSLNAFQQQDPLSQDSLNITDSILKAANRQLQS